MRAALWRPSRRACGLHLPGLVRGSAVHIQYHRPFANEILAQALFDTLQSLPQRRRVVVGRDTDQQVDLADAHELAKKLVREKAFFSQLLFAPCSAKLRSRSRFEKIPAASIPQH